MAMYDTQPTNPAQPVNPTAYTGSNTVLGDISAGVGLGTNIYSLINSIGLTNAASTVFNQSNPFGAYRPQYAAQLSNLMNNPSSVTNLPGYQFLLGQGTAAIDRSSAAPGGVGFGSGAAGMQLEQYGQGLADQFYQQQIQTLMGLSGANIQPSSPFQGLQGMAGAGNIVGQGLGGVNSTLNLLSKLFPGTSASSLTGIDMSQSPYSAAGLTGIDMSQSPYATSFSPYVTSPQYGGGGGGPATDISITDPTAGGGGDYSSPFTYPNAAGGEAATGLQDPGMTNANQIGYTQPNLPPSGGINLPSSVGQYISDIGSVAGIATGLERGGVAGDVSAALSGGKLASNLGLLPSSVSSVLGPAAGALGVVEGVKQGGPLGYTSAAASAAGTYAGASAASTALGGSAFAGADIAAGVASGVGIPLAFYGLVQMLSGLDQYNMADVKQNINEQIGWSQQQMKQYAPYANYSGTNPEYLMYKQTYDQYAAAVQQMQQQVAGSAPIDFAPGIPAGPGFITKPN